MRRLLYISLTFILLTAISGCRHASDKRLVLADTLMWVNPDSSLAILNAIDRDSLISKEDLAYHALLLTQAQFRCNGNCSNDSLINFALDYFSDNHNREHYTRSLLYKGAYYEFHTQQPVEAMKWYKQAEDNADTSDYRNLAQINMRMGMLYYNNYASNNLDLEKFRKAYKYYKKTDDERMSMVALGYMGNLYRATKHQKAIDCLSKARDIAKIINDSNNYYYYYLNELSLAFFMDSSFLKAKAAVLECVNNGRINNAICINAANAYATLIMPDSARCYLNMIDKNSMSTHDSMMCTLALGRIYAAEGNKIESLKQESLGNKISEDIAKSSSRDKIFKAEDDQNIRNNDTKVGIMSRQKSAIFFVSIIAGLLLISIISFVVYYYFKKKDHIKLIDDLKSEGFAKYEDLRNSLHDSDSYFSNTMTEKLKSLEEIMAGAYNPQQDPKSNEVIHRIAPIKDTDSKFWDGLFSYLNFKHDGVMDIIKTDFPQLSTADLNFIGLMCCGFSDAAIAVCKQYRNTASVRSKRRQIKDKMGIEENLVDYLNSLTE